MASVLMARQQFSWHGISSHGTASFLMARHQFIWHGISSHGTASVLMARHQFSWHGISYHGTASVPMARPKPPAHTKQFVPLTTPNTQHHCCSRQSLPVKLALQYKFNDRNTRSALWVTTVRLVLQLCLFFKTLMTCHPILTLITAPHGL
jgi:hypothetical protein